MNGYPIFKYDPTITYSENYSIWYVMNCEERSLYREKMYTPDEGREVFAKMYARHINEGS